ncbi:putative Esterase [Blastococcus saxobsidens DD2]|uniref:Putative Esterase n=1 Tax=Blastococcus saxobsidens (strain DD2) TaxID=1146883 RepID=H6RQZ1_BLASD|nr:putative Esterase [Blastococcus saxobsidens DD2]
MRRARGQWPRAYRPLRLQTLLVQAVVLVGAEVALYTSYSAHDAHFHWATHFLVALLATALWQSLHLLVAARPARGQLITVLLFHLWAMWPDLIFRLGVPHFRWMDVLALGHVSAHYMPGGDTTWLVLALTAVGGYAVLLQRWLAARHAEATAGLPPALGIGGAGIIRPQIDPRTRSLAHEHFGTSASDPLVLLHGLGATAATWRPAARLLAQAGHKVLLPDLLGFGSSMRLGTRFGLADQADAVLRLLQHHGLDRVHLVGHSWGCLVAAAVAERGPEQVSRLTLVEPAVFADPDTARARFARRSWLARATVDDSGLGGLVCGTMCLLRPAFARLAPRLEPDVPEEVAREGVQHSYPAYRDALRSIWEDNPLPALLRSPRHPVHVIVAEQDEAVLPGDVLDLELAAGIETTRVEGTHALPFDRPQLTAGLLMSGIAGSERIGPAHSPSALGDDGDG